MSRNFGFSFASGAPARAEAAAGEHHQPRLSQAPAAASIQISGSAESSRHRHPTTDPGWRGDCNNSAGGWLAPRGQATSHPLTTRSNTYRADSFELAAAKPSGSLASLVGLGRTLPRQDEGASFSLPSGSLVDPGSSPFERGDFIQTVRDCVPVIGAFLFLTVTAIAVAASTFMMFFCEF